MGRRERRIKANEAEAGRRRSSRRRWILAFGVSFVFGTASGFGLRRSGESETSGTSRPDVDLVPAGDRVGVDAGAAERAFQVGYAALRAGRMGDALTSFERASALDPADPRPHHGSGEAYRALQMIDRAEVAYRGAIERDPTLADSLEHLSTLLHDQGKFEEALEVLSRLEKLRPDDPFVLGERALVYIAIDRAADAIPLLRAFNQRKGPQAWGAAQLGRALELTGKIEEAEAAYRMAISVDGAFTVARYWLGQLLARQGRDEESRRELAVHERLRRLETETQQLEVVLAANPDDVNALVSLARVQVMRGRVEQAIGSIDRALTVVPNDPKLLEFRASLERQRQPAPR